MTKTRPGFGEEVGKTDAKSGGVEDEIAGMPVVAETAENWIEIGVRETLPVAAGNDAVNRNNRRDGGMRDGFNDGMIGTP